MTFYFIMLLNGAWRGGNNRASCCTFSRFSASVFQESQACGCICTEQHRVTGKASTRLYGSAGEPGHCQPLVCGLKDTVALCIWVKAGCWPWFTAVIVVVLESSRQTWHLFGMSLLHGSLEGHGCVCIKHTVRSTLQHWTPSTRRCILLGSTYRREQSAVCSDRRDGPGAMAGCERLCHFKLQSSCLQVFLSQISYVLLGVQIVAL